MTLLALVAAAVVAIALPLTLTVGESGRTPHAGVPAAGADGGLPNTVIASAPKPFTNSTTATLVFYSAPSGATFACGLDGAEAIRCSSPFNYTGLHQGTHAVTITATDSRGTDPTPAVVHWTVDTSSPSVPTGLVATAVGPHQIDLSWSPSADNVGVVSYDLYRDDGLLATTGGSATSYVDTSAAPGTSYAYSVLARDGAGNASAPCGDASVTTPITASPHPVQSADASEAGASTSLGASFSSPTSPGDLLVLSAGEFTGASDHLTSVTDSGGNHWSQVGSYDVAGHNSNGEMWYSATTHPATTVTVHTSESVSMTFAVVAFSGVASSEPLDTATGQSGSGASADSGPTAASSGGELVVGFISGHGDEQPITVTSPGYTVLPQSTTGSAASVIVGFQVVPSPGPQAITGSFAAPMYWSAAIAIFRPAG